MPVYTYHCDSCGVTFDKRQSFSDDPLKTCPECEQDALHKVYQPVGIVFKGKGFYATDHRSSSGAHRHSESSKSESSGSSDSGEKSTAVKESKPTAAAAD